MTASTLRGVDNPRPCKAKAGAWAQMLKAYDRQYSDCMIVCKARLPLEKCPASKQAKRDVSFSVSLAAFLGANGYAIEGVTRPGPPAIRSCYADRQN